MWNTSIDRRIDYLSLDNSFMDEFILSHDHPPPFFFEVCHCEDELYFSSLLFSWRYKTPSAYNVPAAAGTGSLQPDVEIAHL